MFKFKVRQIFKIRLGVFVGTVLDIYEIFSFAAFGFYDRRSFKIDLGFCIGKFFSEFRRFLSSVFNPPDGFCLDGSPTVATDARIPLTD